MGTIKEAIYDRITNAAGSYLGTRVYPNAPKQKTSLPFVVFKRISGAPLDSLTGPDSLGTINIRVQVDILGATDAACDAIADLIRDDGTYKMNGWRDMESTPAISGCQLEDEHDDYDDPEDTSGIGIYRKIQDYSIWFTN